jgi:hypothetical protein
MSNVLSRILKNPSKLTHTAEIFKSLPGVGKDTFFNWFGNDMIGKLYYVSTEKPNLLFGQFNSTLKNNILTVINETSGKDTFSISENIKAHITNITLNIEKKGIDPYKVSNCSHVVFLTNNENSIKIESNDRRFCALECDNDKANDKEYFNNLYNEIETKKYNMCFYKWLINIDSDNYNFEGNRPKTDLYKEMQDMNIPPLALFLKKIVIKNVDKCQSNSLFKRFHEFLEKYNINSKYNHLGGI